MAKTSFINIALSFIKISSSALQLIIRYLRNRGVNIYIDLWGKHTFKATNFSVTVTEVTLYCLFLYPNLQFIIANQKPWLLPYSTFGMKIWSDKCPQTLSVLRSEQFSKSIAWGKLFEHWETDNAQGQIFEHIFKVK